MTPLALALVLLAASLHTSWNLLIKSIPERALVSGWAMLIGSLFFMPTLVMHWPLPTLIWPYVIASTIVEIAYMLLLSSAYRYGDFSVVYPIARGAAPALIACWAALFLGEKPGTIGLLGLGAIILGLATVGSEHLLTRSNRSDQRPIQGLALMLALSVAIMISIYSTIDAAAVKLVNPLAYTTLIFFTTGLGQTALLIRHRGLSSAITVLVQYRWRTIAVGLLMLGAYLIVLQVYATSTVSYAAALREVSILMSALVGWRFLGERFGPARLLGSALIVGGIVLIASAPR